MLHERQAEHAALSPSCHSLTHSLPSPARPYYSHTPLVLLLLLLVVVLLLLIVVLLLLLVMARAASSPLSPPAVQAAPCFKTAGLVVVLLLLLVTPLARPPKALPRRPAPLTPSWIIIIISYLLFGSRHALVAQLCCRCSPPH